MSPAFYLVMHTCRAPLRIQPVSTSSCWILHLTPSSRPGPSRCMTGYMRRVTLLGAISVPSTPPHRCSPVRRYKSSVLCPVHLSDDHVLCLLPLQLHQNTSALQEGTCLWYFASSIRINRSFTVHDRVHQAGNPLEGNFCHFNFTTPLQPCKKAYTLHARCFAFLN